ncbi:MAG TPA: sigma-70 family RNA polymerase sigma factor [Kofleriaceae bacterium]|nr:sigma-70 family RNA polymerase sigma factor [Kofleriaceae bacterium]
MQTNTWRDQLISEHTDIARRIALKIARRCPAWMTREDLVAAGMRGLTEAAERYDATRTDAFLPFAEHRIRGAVLDELRRGDVLPRRMRTLARKVTNAIRDIEASGETATDERVAEVLGVTVDHYRSRLAPLAQVQVQPLEGIASVLVSETTTSPDDEVSRREMLAQLRAAIDQLEERDARIITYHFDQELSYQEIAGIFGITGSRVCQLLARALERLRVRLGVATPAMKAAA